MSMYKKSKILPVDSIDIYTQYSNYFAEGRVFHISSFEGVVEKYWKLNGVLDGPYIRFFPNRKLHIECNYSNGKLNGIYKEYNVYGDLIKECAYLENKLNGPYREFHPFFRTKYIECYYANGELHGLYSKYDDNYNSKYYECEYFNGKKKFNPVRMLINGFNGMFVHNLRDYPSNGSSESVLVV